MWKKLLSLNLALLLLLSSLPMVASAETAPAQEGVSTQSDDAYTRGAFAQLLVEDVLGYDLSTYTPNANVSFADVQSNHANYKAISFCAEQGWMTAKENNNFAPDQLVKRREAAVMLFNYLGGASTSGGAWLSDIEEEDDDYEACSVAVASGYMSAESNFFRPDESLGDVEITISNIPTRVFYNGEFDIKVEAGSSMRDILYSQLTDGRGQNLGLSDKDDYFANTYGDAMHIRPCDDGKGNHSLDANAGSAQPDDTGTIIFFTGNNPHEARKYLLTATATLPEWGVYTIATQAEKPILEMRRML